MITVQDHRERATAPLALPSNGVPSRLRVLVVDDHPAIRLGLLQLLDDQPDFDVVDAACSAEEARSLAEREPIDVAVVDYQLGARSGLWLTRMLKRLERPPRVVIYSAFSDGPLAAACVVAGADGLVSKGGTGAELCHAIRAVSRGQSRLPLVPPTLAGAMRRRLGSEEQAVFGMLLAGIDPDEIAITLGISEQSLDSRRWAMLHKLEGLRPDPAGAHVAAGRIKRRRAPGC
ncbi:MAG TPA: response regulator transcription factor [Solirubrobacteraceae bacterium]|nr:response regulator transcription factor [Solirubrobacteraceae bacterium]